MALWVMADLHLSLGRPKPMNRFGPRWTDHAAKIGARWRALVRDGDTVVVPGDISWADDLEGAEPDFAALDVVVFLSSHSFPRHSFFATVNFPLHSPKPVDIFPSRGYTWRRFQIGR